MGTTIPVVFEGTPTLTPAKVNILKAWYVDSLGDSDKADSVFESAIYNAFSEALEGTLALLYEHSEIKKSHGNFKRAVLVTSAVAIGYYYIKHEAEVKAKASVVIVKAKSLGSDVIDKATKI